MKIRYYLIGITAVLVTVYCISLYQIDQTRIKKTGFADRNLIVQQLEEQYELDGSCEASDQYEVIYCNQEEYEQQLYKAYGNEEIIMDLTENGSIIGKVIFGQSDNQLQLYKQQMKHIVTIAIGCALLLLYVVSFIYYRRLIKPFHTLQQFAAHISAGDFEFALHMNKHNYFGAFTESFDLMREELLRAKQGEYEANLGKKELVASLSHDIKTPVSTIKANCELLLAMNQQEKVQKKLEIIEKKTDMINTLINNMFHATLEEMQMLKVQPQENLSTLLIPMFEEINHYDLIHYKQQVLPCILVFDKVRLSQVIDNVISNSYKYANTEILVSTAIRDNYYVITIKDYGPGVNEEELPFLFGKFYRGGNATNSNGSGLGLYLANQFMTSMHGAIECYNDDGFVVELCIQIAN